MNLSSEDIIGAAKAFNAFAIDAGLPAMEAWLRWEKRTQFENLDLILIAHEAALLRAAATHREGAPRA